jgi:hypothetical protein
MENASYSVDFSKKINQAKAGAGATYDVVCGHCGSTAAKLVHESCGDNYEEPLKYKGTPEKEKKKEFRASANRFNQNNHKLRDPNEYQRDLPKYFPEVNHSQDIVCSNCGNIAAKLYPLRDNMYANKEENNVNKIK